MNLVLVRREQHAADDGRADLTELLGSSLTASGS
jgi:hypothetical protein